MFNKKERQVAIRLRFLNAWVQGGAILADITPDLSRYGSRFSQASDSRLLMSDETCGTHVCYKAVASPGR